MPFAPTARGGDPLMTQSGDSGTTPLTGSQHRVQFLVQKRLNEPAHTKPDAFTERVPALRESQRPFRLSCGQRFWALLRFLYTDFDGLPSVIAL
jgi:hypothetical protein